MNLKIESLLGSFGRLEMIASYGKKELDANMASWALYTYTESETYGFTPKYILEQSFFGFSNKLTTGVDIYRSPTSRSFTATGSGRRERPSRTCTRTVSPSTSGMNSASSRT